MGRSKDEVVVKFVSNSCMDVTGSAVLISYKNNDYLIEFGMIQGVGTMEQEYKMNMQYANNLNIDNLKCILVSHQNVDHIGLIPNLIKRGFSGDIFGSYEALEFSKPLLEDSAFILDKTVQSITKKNKKVEHIYKIEDVNKTCDLMRAYDIGKVYEYDEYMSFQFIPTNHLTGSCQINIWIKKDNGQKVKIWYSGDLGSELATHFGYFLRDTEVSTTSNLAICECTYFGNINEYTKQDGINERKDMKKNILHTLKNNGKVVIPTFSMQRSQHLMLEIWKFFKDDESFEFDIVVDGRLTKRINNTFTKILSGEDKELWKSCLKWRHFKFIESYKETLALMSTRKPMVVCCSSGMVQNGHSVDWVASSISCSKDTIMCVGYVPENSIMDRLIKHEEKIEWNKKTYIPSCKVIKYNTFSSHMSANGIVKLLKQMNTGSIVFHHGSKIAKNNAVEIVKEELMKIGKTTKVYGSYKNMEIKL